MAKAVSSAIKELLPKDPLFRLFVINGFTGACIAGLVLAGILWSNIGNLRVLVMGSEAPVLPLLMLAAGLLITLVSVVIGSAVMLLERSDGKAGTPDRGLPVLVDEDLRSIPIAVKVPCRRIYPE